jgi:hypothetical protein
MALGRVFRSRGWYETSKGEAASLVSGAGSGGAALVRLIGSGGQSDSSSQGGYLIGYSLYALLKMVPVLNYDSLGLGAGQFSDAHDSPVVAPVY